MIGPLVGGCKTFARDLGVSFATRLFSSRRFKKTQTSGFQANRLRSPTVSILSLRTLHEHRPETRDMPQGPILEGMSNNAELIERRKIGTW